MVFKLCFASFLTWGVSVHVLSAKSWPRSQTTSCCPLVCQFTSERRTLKFSLCVLTLDLCVLSWRSVCLKTRTPSAPVPAAACPWQAAALGDWRGSTRLTGTTTGAAGHLPTSACWNMRAPGFKGSRDETRRLSTAFLICLYGLPTHQHPPPENRSSLTGTLRKRNRKKKTKKH